MYDPERASGAGAFIISSERGARFYFVLRVFIPIRSSQKQQPQTEEFVFAV